MKILFLSVAAIVILGAFEIEGGYESPPSAQTYGNARVISDAMMQKCAKIYNEVPAIARALSSTRVNRHSSYEVNLYNQAAGTHLRLINRFNANCAGKQSYSARKAAREQNCGY